MNKVRMTDTLEQTLKAWEQRSTCLIHQVAAIITDQQGKRILSIGYNGAPARCKDCLEIGQCNVKYNQQTQGVKNHKLCRGAHAEVNAINNAAKHGISVENGCMYCTYMPCANCMKSIINSGILYVKYFNEHEDGLSTLLAQEAGILLCASV